MTDKEGEDDGKREAAIASTCPLQPDFNPKGVSQDQLAKFQELHRRRLQLKSKSKFDKKSRGFSCTYRKSHGRNLYSKDHSDTDPVSSTMVEDSIDLSLRSQNSNDDFPLQKDSLKSHGEPPKRRKLHWGLDTKERWERKANM